MAVNAIGMGIQGIVRKRKNGRRKYTTQCARIQYLRYMVSDSVMVHSSGCGSTFTTNMARED